MMPKFSAVCSQALSFLSLPIRLLSSECCENVFISLISAQMKTATEGKLMLGWDGQAHVKM